MASILAEAVVGKVCEMAIQQVANEVSIVWNFSEDFERLKNIIRQINYFLDEADEKSSRQKDFVKEWLHSVRDIAWEAEDLLQICAVDFMYASNTQLCTSSYNQLILHHQMGRRIRKAKARMSSVIEDGNQLNIAHTLLSRISSRIIPETKVYKTGFPASDSKPVAIQPKIESTVNLLENPQFPVIAVVGMGGLGKTYLLQHVYDAQKGRYEKSAWLSVSQFYSFSKLLNDLAFQLSRDLSREIKESGVSEEVAAQSIHNFILGKRCLIVLDDVWRVTREGDLIAKLGIPTGADNQCKVLVSTRSREVSANLNAKIYEMESLRDEESWKLFCVYAFPESEENKAPEPLKEVALNIVKECANLPLAIKTIAASLANTTVPGEWQSKLSKLKKVSDPSNPVMDILKLSYDSLPAHLKACFAYLSFFPEDEKIECEYLTYIWMAEGFIPAGENPWDCLYQLANLCLIEVWEDELVRKWCKIHDLLLDLAILISRENKCAFGLEDAFSKLPCVNTGGGRWCHLFLAKKVIDEHAISQRRPVSPTLDRTLSLSHNAEIGRNIPAMLFGGMRVLRVLDLSFTNISTLPDCVGEMKLLKVLHLKQTEIEKVPDCVRRLKSLSYLNVSSSEAPKWISELVSSAFGRPV
ncbi:hypothetical protein SUGI_0630460 [Cryptomeria japonica]|uniref:putative disease resistance protein RGA3 n=1 Tax=Cryptomeria japonica TaxID=3369 RepID=UPI0024147728|nr:putative disease resistance protein RGA3 [Cryptomeria japonica]GLJ31421.1 hypothetical protein SUGI_0630460 [Cryptomeria japonica]